MGKTPEQQRLIRLAHKVLAAEEADRVQLAQRLHDETSQTLIAIKLHLETIRTGSETDRKLSDEELDEVITLTRQAIEQIRFIIYRLRPHILSFDLNQTLEDLCNDFTSRTKRVVTYHGTNHMAALPSLISSSFCCFLQEALLFFEKQMSFSRARVSFSQLDGVLYLSVRVGAKKKLGDANPSGSLPAEGSGIAALAERFELLGGGIKKDSNAGEGICMTAFLSCDPDDEKEEKRL